MEERFRDQLFETQELIDFKPRPALGALLYLSVLTRPDISTAVRLLAQETEHPTAAVKVGIERVFRYLNGNQNHGLVLHGNGDTQRDGLVVYCDAAFAVERERKSSTGFAIFYDGNLVEWGSKKQSTVTLSSTESEYIAMATAVQECIGIKMVLKDLGMDVEVVTVFEDNQGAQHLAESKAVTQRSRHIDTKYHWLREQVQQNELHVKYCPTL
ncbi:Integrase, catalytic core protein [Phytophthora megakarya]|uniref:Integrase, catalytic core protein n=1 Tax=Phytophthora megakarya TaxID=4795 RepID=A0A225VWX4_9STRA|nr:Integrase, catalytic core protein [Phytophthora megakarya]